MQTNQRFGNIATPATRLFFTAVLLYWAGGLLVMMNYGKAEGFLLMRNVGSPIPDFLFTYLTHVGDGLMAVAVCVLWLFQKKWPRAIVLFAAFAVSGLLAQLIKNTVASPRPAPFFKANGQLIDAVNGVELLQSHNSFPSGHTATAFALATSLVLLMPWWQKRWWLAFIVAVGIGYSRVYLGQHFLQDVLAGSVLGVLSAAAVYLLLRKWNPPFTRAAW